MNKSQNKECYFNPYQLETFFLKFNKKLILTQTKKEIKKKITITNTVSQQRYVSPRTEQWVK